MAPKKQPKKNNKTSVLAYCSSSCKHFIPQPGPKVSKKGNVYYRVILLCNECDTQIFDTCKLRLLADQPAGFELDI